MTMAKWEYDIELVDFVSGEGETAIDSAKIN